jgi:NADPH:quinone reductase-like Zn-dependent oxidoreductase
MGRRAEMIEVLHFVREGKLKPVIDSVMPLAQAADAHRRIEAREHFGKIVLVP